MDNTPVISQKHLDRQCSESEDGIVPRSKEDPFDLEPDSLETSHPKYSDNILVKDIMEKQKNDGPNHQSSEKSNLKNILTEKNEESEYCFIQREQEPHEDLTIYSTVTLSKDDIKPNCWQNTDTSKEDNKHIQETRNIIQMYTSLKEQLKENTNLKITVSEDKRMLVACVNSEGATLKFGSISLTIPKGALPEETFVFMYNLGYRISPGSIPLCPEVMCGPQGLRFQMYVTLSVELFGNITKRKPMVFCKQKGSDWKKIYEVGGTSFIKNHKSYTLINHFSDFKTVDQSNFDGSEGEEHQLVQISSSKQSFNFRAEVLIELRKLQNFDPINTSNSVKHFYCGQETAIEILTGDRRIRYCCEELRDNNLSAVGRCISYADSIIPSHISCNVGTSIIQMKLVESRDCTIKKPQTNVNFDNMEAVLATIKESITPEFQEWLLKDLSEDERCHISIDLAVMRYLSMNDNDLRKLIPQLQRYGMKVVADKVKKIVEASPFDHTRRSLPATPTEEIQPLMSCASGFPRVNEILDADSGPHGIPCESGDSEGGFEGPERLSTDSLARYNNNEDETASNQGNEINTESPYLNVKLDDFRRTDEVESPYTTYHAK